MQEDYSRRSPRRALGIVEWSLGTIGLALLLGAAFAAAHRSVAAERALGEFRELQARRTPAAVAPRVDGIPELAALAQDTPDQALWSEEARGYWERSFERDVAAPVAALSIPGLSLRLAVLADVDEDSLHRSVGWMPWTARPGESGNVGIAGHRDSHFRKLKDIRLGDRIVLEALSGPREYEVTGLTVVAPDENGVLSQERGDRLTLVTCYPFYYVGSAPERWVVSAEPVETLSGDDRPLASP